MVDLVATASVLQQLSITPSAKQYMTGNVNTSVLLRHWSYGRERSETLAAAVLSVEGFTDIDPQAPRGGPDGTKDIVCHRNGRQFIAACYFPGSDVNFTKVKAKFEDDLSGAKTNKAAGFVFLTGQVLTVQQRETLKALTPWPHTEIYHNDRLTAILNSPVGYGLRLEFLHLGMALEEQISFWQHTKSVFAMAAQRQEARFNALEELVGSTRDAVLIALGHEPHGSRSNAAGVCHSDGLGNDAWHMPSPFPLSMSVDALRQIHAAMYSTRVDPPDHRTAYSGQLRPCNVWIGAPGSSPAEAFFVPPNWEVVPSKLAGILEDWNQRLPAVIGKLENEKLVAAANLFLDILALHPFLDGNGQMAHFVLANMLKGLLGTDIVFALPQTEEYYLSLRAADAGDRTRFFNLLQTSVKRPTA